MKMVCRKPIRAGVAAGLPCCGLLLAWAQEPASAPADNTEVNDRTNADSDRQEVQFALRMKRKRWRQKL